MDIKKKDNSNLLIIVGFICLILSIGVKIAWENHIKPLVTDEKVLSVKDPYEFAAVLNGSYADGVVKFDLQTNAPNGTKIDIFGVDTTGGELKTETVVKRGLGEASVEVKSDLPPGVIQAVAIVDMTRQDAKSLAVNRYGEFGEKIKGENIATTDGIHVAAGSDTKYIPYPTKEDAKIALNKEFANLIDGFFLMYSGFFDSISPKEEGNWEEINLVFNDDFVNNNWDTFDKGQKKYIFDLFQQIPAFYMMVDEGTAVKVNFLDTKGNILDKNY